MTKRFHFGHLFDHVHIRVRDYEASKRFYRAVFDALGIELDDRGTYVQVDEFSFAPGSPATTGLHIAFQARDHDTVRGELSVLVLPGEFDRMAGDPSLRRTCQADSRGSPSSPSCTSFSA